MQTLEIYTDGSHFKGSDRVGYGICFQDPVDQTKIYTHSAALDVASFRDYYNITVSNPTAELMAAVKVMELLDGIRNHRIIIYSDYNGVQFWLKGEWQAKKQYIKDIVTKGQVRIEQLTKNGNVVELKWLKGHSGNKMNNLADDLAKRMDNTSTIKQFFTKTE